jgi:hypothetical protein
MSFPFGKTLCFVFIPHNFRATHYSDKENLPFPPLFLNPSDESEDISRESSLQINLTLAIAAAAKIVP